MMRILQNYETNQLDSSGYRVLPLINYLGEPEFDI